MNLPFFQVGERGVSWVKKHHKGSLRCASSTVLCVPYGSSGTVDAIPFLKGHSKRIIWGLLQLSMVLKGFFLLVCLTYLILLLEADVMLFI